VITKVIEQSDQWQNKKVKKSILTVNLFLKSAKILLHSPEHATCKDSLSRSGVVLMKALEKVCEKDKSMGNLKNKVKELKTLVDN